MARNYSTFAVAKMLQVDPGSVANWIDSKILNAHRTPGGHRRVSSENLLAFLREHDMPIPEQLETSTVRILIVDDEVDIAKLISDNVQAAYPEFEISRAHDGFRAGMMAADLSPDIVILDIHMPGMDGFEVCKQLKSLEKNKNLDIIAITGLCSEESSCRILDCGARICLPKPIDFANLIREIETSILKR